MSLKYKYNEENAHKKCKNIYELPNRQASTANYIE